MNIDPNNDNVSVTQESGREGECVYPRPAAEIDAREAADRIGINLATMNECVALGAAQPDPANLYDGLWYEGELTALYADTNLGKSILAVQIAEHLAYSGKRVLYCDLELTDKGFEMRCRDLDSGRNHEFPVNLYRMSFDQTQFEDLFGKSDGDDDLFLEAIEMVGRELKVEAVIIDNISVISGSLQSGDKAVSLVKRLLKMRNDNNWSILFLAHTNKTDKRMPLSRDDMSGSKKIMNLIDSAFSIGASLLKPELRYLKQTKVRQNKYTYHGGNVLICEINRVDGILKYIVKGTDEEYNMLITPQEKKRKELVEQIRKMSAEGLEPKEIAEAMAMSVNSVRAILK